MVQGGGGNMGEEGENVRERDVCGRRGNVREGDSGRGGGNIKWDVIKKRNGSQAMGI